ncbi:type II/IV secretion system ATPase subunit [Haloarcula onubensis]|uniref:Type II/IV secretion system ATPase subunit n=1 Tax=Haloarcula onubensis TaxID=2950539 RepID=A0ABU2FQF3_9EURY|nr:type II/IV secretion system ATPase subunit [Halomicroarcula sp. S3CR25-11]MDS0282973.1 type II/IV secretion system ATPase subunit [Halomicroarcula sp. S3CR25-11]
MAIEDTNEAGSDGVDGGVTSPDRTATVGGYTWEDLRRELHDGGAFNRADYLGFDPETIAERLEDAAGVAKGVNEPFAEYIDPDTTPVVKGEYTWEHFKQEYYYEAGAKPWHNGDQPRDKQGEVVPFDAGEYLGFDPDETENQLSLAEDFATELEELVDERTVDVNPELDEDEFFSTREGHTTVVNRYDLERAVPFAKKTHFKELERYWVNKPYACVVIFQSRKENEKKYYVVEPHLNPIEEDLQGFLSGKLKTAIKYSEDEVIVKGSNADRAQVIQREAEQLLSRYDLYDSAVSSSAGSSGGGFLDQLKELFNDEEVTPAEASGQLEGLSVRPEPAILEDDPSTLTEYQVEKLLYMLKRDFIGYGLIDPVKHDINVEDISCDGYNSRVFVYHTDYEQIISNVEHGETDLDDFVVKLAQRSGKGISKRQPQIDATLPDGSRAQLTLGREVSDHGTNYTIRQFKDVPFTPIDLINWNTFSLDEMAFMWLCIENNKSLIFAGGTASGKTTSLNAVSLFIPSNSKIVSIEDTREVELPQRNWVASVTRPSFGEDDKGDVDEFDLLEAALRQRPDYIVMGEIRGEEGRTLFQVMSTGHTTYTTFHADSVGEVIKRFTTEPINVSKTLFTALDLVSIQTQTRVDGSKVRRNKSLTEINEYSAENDEINVRDVYEWRAETDEYIQMGNSNTLEEIKFDRGWTQEKLDEELFKRKVVLAYLIEQGINSYTEVAASIQAFINDPETILTLIANDQLERSLEDLREMESVKIDIDQEKEEMVPRPDAPPEMVEETKQVLDNAGPLFTKYKSGDTPDIVSALMDGDALEESDTEDDDVTAFGQFVPKAGKEADSG